jgi:hypothetical protein
MDVQDCAITRTIVSKGTRDTADGEQCDRAEPKGYVDTGSQRGHITDLAAMERTVRQGQ